MRMRCINANWHEEGIKDTELIKDPELTIGHFYNSIQDNIIIEDQSEGPYVSFVGNSGQVIQRPKRIFEVVTDKEMGLYNKFKVERVDGGSNLGNKHQNCKYFVLDLTHDKHAIPAIIAYAESCKDEYPFLYRDLRKIIDENEKSTKS
jgi:hypothetical protein